jgi:hypothetical protein
MQIEKHSPAAYAFGPLFRTEASLQADYFHAERQSHGLAIGCRVDQHGTAMVLVSGVSAFRFRRYVRVAFETDRTGGREGTLAN